MPGEGIMSSGVGVIDGCALDNVECSELNFASYGRSVSALNP